MSETTVEIELEVVPVYVVFTPLKVRWWGESEERIDFFFLI